MTLSALFTLFFDFSYICVIIKANLMGIGFGAVVGPVNSVQLHR